MNLNVTYGKNGNDRKYAYHHSSVPVIPAEAGIQKSAALSRHLSTSFIPVIPAAQPFDFPGRASLFFLIIRVFREIRG